MELVEFFWLSWQLAAGCVGVSGVAECRAEMVGQRQGRDLRHWQGESVSL